MMTPKAALRSVLDQYTGLSGRAPRSEYWWWTMWVAVVCIVFGVPIAVLANMTSFDAAGPIAGILGSLWAAVMLGTIIPTVTVTVRRLHDANLSGWFYLVNFVLVAGPLALLVMTILPSSPAGARFDKVVAKNAAPAWNSQRLS